MSGIYGCWRNNFSKDKFKEWLWKQAAAQVCHFHLDNGVFTADSFCQDCYNKKQTQSFSAVRSQHQNAQAEHAFQTIMYMARTFLIHVSLHWDDCRVDDLSLWSFAVQHAAWLYNRLPNQVSGLTPIKLATKTKTDHWDLLRTPVFVLNPKLQDGKKIPKWNCRSRLGKFLGFSDEHSSLAANVWNLTTGYISPQFHLVFYNEFEMVIGTGGATDDSDIADEICN